MPSSFELGVEYNAQHDAYIVYPCCNITSEEDCKVWLDAYIRLFAPLRKRIDCVIILSMFSVAPEIVDVWAKYRVRLYREIIRFSVRVETDTSMLATSSRQLATGIATDIPTALSQLVELRAIED
ncbi:MAG: hypothetical protein H7Z43_08710 [Clostridia bacterium]|nr:hypothetical protein [Deltaproteobacteria bacterium]